jgi:hypothetical protein
MELAKLDGSEVVVLETDKKAVLEYGYRYVVLQKDAFAVSPSAPSAQSSVARTRLRRLERELEDMLQKPFFSDARTSLFALSGEAKSCTEVDREAVMNPNVDPVSRMGVDPDKHVITWFVGGPEE